MLFLIRASCRVTRQKLSLLQEGEGGGVNRYTCGRGDPPEIVVIELEGGRGNVCPYDIS